VAAAINDLRRRIHNRHSIASGDFSSWAVTIAGRLPQKLAGEIERARTDIAKPADLGEIFRAIQRWIDRVGDLDQSPALLNTAAIIRQIAA